MGSNFRTATLVVYSVGGFCAPAVMRAQSPDELRVEHADCSMFGPQRERFSREARERYALSAVTEQVRHRMSLPSGSKHTSATEDANRTNLIDVRIFQALRDAGVAPAPKTTDAEFIRRVTLDLTGRVPTPDRLLAFLDDTSPDKRVKLVDMLMGTPEFLDKWTMYFGDRFKNAQRTSQVTMYPQGRDAFYNWIKTSLTNNKPYDQMVREIIATRSTNSFDVDGATVNWLVNGRVNGGPVNDIWDQQAANIADTFLGISHVNCLLCHNGRGHLDALSLWGKQTSRMQAWQFASLLSHSETINTRVDPNNPNLAYWSIQDNVRYKTDYALNTTTGNRPARQPLGTIRTAAPAYLFTGKSPSASENYRDFLAREVTADFQFARASVNYIWEQLFGRGIVSPANQFDLARLDPDNPPPDPWTLQPSNPALLRDLAKAFIESGYSIKGLLRLITTSDTYQLSSRYEGEWNPAWEPLFARKMVRRLWGEEIMDAVAQTTSLIPVYNIANLGPIAWAMQAPEPIALNSAFLNSFLPGNRDDQERRNEGGLQQALNLMNDTFVVSRTRSTTTNGVVSLTSRALKFNNDGLIDHLYLTVLSRYPDTEERASANTYLSTGNRTQKAEDLLWSLFNKVDFIFNY